MKRRLLTQAVIEAAGVPREGISPIPIGLVEKPEEGGWSGVPNQHGSTYQPYAVIIPGNGQLQRPQGGLGQSSEWMFAYQIACYGRSPSSVEWVADEVREAIRTLARHSIDMDGVYVVQQVAYSSIGTISKYDATDPPTWGQVDSLVIHLSKEQ